MQRLKTKGIEGRYVNYAENKTILATWESPTLLVLDFHNTANVDVDSEDFSKTLLGTLKIRVQ